MGPTITVWKYLSCTPVNSSKSCNHFSSVHFQTNFKKYQCSLFVGFLDVLWEIFGTRFVYLKLYQTNFLNVLQEKSCKIQLICGQWKLQPVSNILLTDTWPFARKLSTLWLHHKLFFPNAERQQKHLWPFDNCSKNRTKHLKWRQIKKTPCLSLPILC